MGDARSGVLTSGEIVNLALNGVMQIGWLVGPLAAGAVVATAASAQAQGGVNFASEALQIDLTRLSPASGFKRLAPSQAGLNLVKTVIAATVVGAVAWSAVSALLADSPRFALVDPVASGLGAWTHAVAFLKRAALALLALAAADFGLQKWRTGQSLRMTKQEVRDDHKLAEGNPEIKARVRRVQREMLRKRMLAAVPKATVIITNPTHFAVAVKYTRGQAAPEVVAKGADNLALKIRTIAREHGVPIVENPPLARAIYRQVDVGESIPGDLFEAVAEVLAYLIRLKQLVL
jgi:flagellar biosynthetic protein FlhB